MHIHQWKLAGCGDKMEHMHATVMLLAYYAATSACTAAVMAQIAVTLCTGPHARDVNGYQYCDKRY